MRHRSTSNATPTVALCSCFSATSWRSKSRVIHIATAACIEGSQSDGSAAGRIRLLNRAMLGGLLAGVVGTLAMDLVWFARYKRGGGESAFVTWEFSVGL